jgi:flagellar hook assembly protein FlgD
MTGTPTATPTTPPFCFNLNGNFPNPIKTDTHIVYELCRDSDVSAMIYTVSGEKVRKISQHGSIGKNTIYWDCQNNHGKDVGSGVYLYSIEAISGNDKTKKWGKLVVLK